MAYTGEVLEVHLEEGRWERRAYPERVFKEVLAGRGYNALFLREQVKPGIDPLGPDNVLVLSCGLLTGTPAPASSRVHIGALSPLTGILGSSNVGGLLGRALRSCGVQALVIRGRSRFPAVLWINSREVRVEAAEDLWGLDTWETESRLRAGFTGSEAGILTIGPAGENEVAFACAMSDFDHAAGRTGLGAVMGAKRLKAIAVHKEGTDVPPLDRAAGAAIRDYARRIRRAPEFSFFRDHGGAGYVTWCDDMGILATRNYRSSRFEAVDSLDGRRLRPHAVETRGCPGCPVRCKARLSFKGDGPRAGVFNRPEFESLVNLGAKCGLADLESVVRLDNLCSKLGMDSVSAGTVVGFAMDLFDRGIIGRAQTGGLDLSWGNKTSMEVLVRQIALRQGLGAVLAGGVRRAAQELGYGAERYAPHVKGLELPGYHPAYIMGTALGYMVSSRGGDFSSVYASLEYAPPNERAETGIERRFSPHIGEIQGKAFMVRRAVLANIALDCLGICKVPVLALQRGFDLEAEARLVRNLAGLDIHVRDLMRLGKRVADLERLFNIEHGAGPRDDRLPDMFMTKEYGSDETSKRRYEIMLREYYALMGWDEQGRPRETDADRPGARNGGGSKKSAFPGVIGELETGQF